MFRKTRDYLDIRFGFEGQNCLRLSRFGDAMLGLQIYEMASCLPEQRVLVWIIHFFVACGNTVKLIVNYCKKYNFHEDVPSCVISLKRGREEVLNIMGHFRRGTYVQKYLNKIKFGLTKHQVTEGN